MKNRDGRGHVQTSLVLGLVVIQNCAPFMMCEDYSIEIGDSTTINDDQWNQILTHFDDSTIYQTAAYGRVRWPRSELIRVIAIGKNQIRAAAQLRVQKISTLNIKFAYIRWGPIFRTKASGSDLDALKAILRSLKGMMRTRRYYLMRIISRVFVHEADSALVRELFLSTGFSDSRSLSPYRTFLVDLRPTMDDIRKRLEKRWRNRLCRAQENGLVVEIMNTSESFGLFSKLYGELLERKKFHPTVDSNDFALMQPYLVESQKINVAVCYYNGIPLGASLFSNIGKVGLCLLSASTAEGLNMHAPYLLKWATLSWMKQRGIEAVDLGGGGGATTKSVDDFKSRMGGIKATHIDCYEAALGTISKAALRAYSFFSSHLHSARLLCYYVTFLILFFRSHYFICNLLL